MEFKGFRLLGRKQYEEANKHLVEAKGIHRGNQPLVAVRRCPVCLLVAVAVAFGPSWWRVGWSQLAVRVATGAHNGKAYTALSTYCWPHPLFLCHK